MLVFLFTDIEGSTRLWEEHTRVMAGVIARHDEILTELVSGHGGRITKHTGDGITAVFEAGQPLECALRAQVRFAGEAWAEIGALPIRTGLHAGEAQFHRSAGTADGDYFGPPVNATARVMSAAWGGQILLTPEVTQVSRLPEQATLLDLGQHLLKNVSAPQQLYQLLHPRLPRQQFPPPRTLSGRSIGQAVSEQGARLAQLAPSQMAVSLVGAALLPAVLGDRPAGSPALAANVGVLRDLGAGTLAGFLSWFAEHLPVGGGEEIRASLERELQRRWTDDAALRRDAGRLLRAVDGVEATLLAATGEVREALARGLAVLGGQFDEFRWMLGDVQEALAEVHGLQREQLDLQRRQLARTEELLALHKEQARIPPATAVGPQALQPRVPAFVDEEAQDVDQRPVFVAREAELARLEGFLELALAGHGRVVFVTGGPGRGKTALLAEFARLAMESCADLLVAGGNCNAYSGVGDPYLPFREVLSLLSGDAEAAWAAGAISRDHALRLWGALPLAAQALVEHGPHVVPTLVPGPALLSRAMAVAPAETPWLQQLRARVERQLPPSEDLEQSQLFQQVTHVLRALARAHPLLLILDDLQWVDTASASLLFHLGRRLEGSRILVAGTYRPEEVTLGLHGGGHPLEKLLVEFKRDFGDVWVDLAEVDQPEGQRFVDALLGAEPNRLGEGFRRALFEHTAGHPLFTIELLRAMQEQGDLVQDESGCWVQGSALHWDTLPARVEGVIEARIGRLEEELREILTVASVEGEEFTAQVVARVQGLDERQTLRRLAQQLEKRHRLVREQPAVRAGRLRLSRYRFAHTMFQQYLYSDLSDGERALLHGEVARLLEELYEGRLEEVAVHLARHFDRAGDCPQAVEYYRLAGDTALSSYANREAEDHFRRAVELCEADAECAGLLARLGETLARQDCFEEGLAVLRQAIELYHSLGDLEAVAHLYARSGRAASTAVGFPESLTICLEGLDAVEGAPPSGELARLLHEAARAYHFSGQSATAEPFCRQAIDMAQHCSAVDVQADALATLGVLPHLTGEEALATLRKAVELAEVHGELAIAFRAHNNLGVLMLNIHEDARGSLRHFSQAVSLDRKRGAGAATITPLLSVVGQSLAIGDLQGSDEALQSMAQLAASLPNPQTVQGVVEYARGYVAAFKGDLDEALVFYRAAQSASLARSDRMTLFNCSSSMASVYLAMDRRHRLESWEEAEQALHTAITIADDGLASGLPERAALSAVYARQGRLDDARRFLAEAEAGAALDPTPVAEFSVRAACLELAIAERRWADALDAVEQNAAFQLRRERVGYWAAEIETWADIHLRRGEPGDFERAYVLLRQARDIYHKLGIPERATAVEERLDALHADLFDQARHRDMLSHELAVAGRIQAGLLPEALPTLTGWNVAAAFEPARETPSDFYDFVPLPGGCLGIVVAKVARNGGGAALYMAMIRTLLRSSAALHPLEPGQVLATVNEQILAETDTDVLVTVLYAVLDPETGIIFYANGGHNPGYLFKSGDAHPLAGTGMALGVGPGIAPDARWETGRVTMVPGDTLLLYTDGAVDARTAEGEPFGLERLLATAQTHLPRPAAGMQDGLLDEIHRFVGDAPRFDDLTLVVVARM